MLRFKYVNKVVRESDMEAVIYDENDNQIWDKRIDPINAITITPGYLASNIEIFGDEKNPETQKMLEDIQSIYMPNRVMVYGASGSADLKNIIPFVSYYPPAKDGKPLVYVCQNFSCKLPTSDFKVVKEQLGGY